MKRRFEVWLLALMTGLLVLLSPVTVLASEGNPGQEDLLKDGVLTVGMEVNYAPFNWTQPNDENGAVPLANSPGEYANGYDVWVAQQVAKDMGLDLEIIKIEWDGLVPALISGKIDCIISGMSPTPERREEVDFSDTYYFSDLVMVVRRDGPYTEAHSLEDFEGAKITGQLNTFHYSVIDQIPGVDKQTALDSFPTMISALLSSKIDGYVSERPGAMAALHSQPELTFTAFDEGKGFESETDETSVAVALDKGSGLMDDINHAVDQIDEEKQEEVMDHMVQIAPAEEEAEEGEEETSGGFWSGVSYIWKEYRGLFMRGVGMTLLLAIVGTAIGFVIGFLVQLVRSIKMKVRWNGFQRFLIRLCQIICTCYVELFRSTPMMVQAIMIYYGSKVLFGTDLPAMSAGLIVISVNTGAYLAETIRGGIDSVDPGQWEAATSMGLTDSQTLFGIIMPQALKAILPSIGNELIVNLKDSSVLNVISVTELFFITKGVAGTTYKIFETYFITLVIYLILTLALSKLLSYLLRRRGNEFNLTSATNS